MKREPNFEINSVDLQKQHEIIEQMRIKNTEEYNKCGKKKNFMIVTYGCQMNEHDSEKLIAMLRLMDYEQTNHKEKADLIIYNTCCVRENAELKVYGNLGALKNLKAKNNDLIIAVCGCMMQQPKVVKEIKQKYKHVDLVFGTHNLHKFPELLANCRHSDDMIIEIWGQEGSIVEGIPALRKYGIKAFVNIMLGCNNFCTYCIVPYTRGRERSREVGDIVKEVIELAQNGTKEITLLGQNVNSYGNKNFTFAMLLKELNKIKGIERIRFMTSHPKDLSQELIDVMAECDKVCEHIHLPVQAGSNKVLEKMNRKYTRETYLDLVDRLKRKIPEISISTDIIVGFPGETDEDFEKTLDIVEKVKFDFAFTFLYSIREGTPAAQMQDQVEDSIKHKRFNSLVDKVNKIGNEINKQYLNSIIEVLVEGTSKTDISRFMGRTRQNKLVNFSSEETEENLIGKLVQVKITETKTFSLNGEMLG